MSSEIVKSLKIRQDGDDWVADICSHSNNVTPAYYEKWVYGEGLDGKFKTKEDLIKGLLLDFWVGNFQGGSSTKIGKFTKFLATQDDTWYKDITDRYNHLIKLQREKTGDKINFALKVRKDKECMRVLYKMFLGFRQSCKPTIIRFIKNDLSGYIEQGRRRNMLYLTLYKENATKYTSTSRLYQAIKTVKKNGYNYELLEV